MPDAPKLTVAELWQSLADAPEIGTRWRHYKTGAVYRVTGWCIREHDQAPCVLYRAPAVPDEELPPVMCRPLSEWQESVGGTPRFTQAGG